MINNCDDEIKKLIDPKSGFTLYIRKFKDASLSQVSTVDSFPIPTPYGAHEINGTLIKKLQSMQQESFELIQSNEAMISTMQKKLGILSKLIVILCLAILASIFF